MNNYVCKNAQIFKNGLYCGIKCSATNDFCAFQRYCQEKRGAEHTSSAINCRLNPDNNKDEFIDAPKEQIQIKEELVDNRIIETIDTTNKYIEIKESENQQNDEEIEVLEGQEDIEFVEFINNEEISEEEIKEIDE